MHSRRGFVKGLVATIAATVIGLFTLGRSEPVQAASSRTVLPALTKVPMFRQYQDEPSTNEGKAARRNAYLASVVAAARKVASPSNVYLVKYKEHAFAEEIWVPILIAFSPDGTVHWSDLSRTVGFLWFEQQYPAGRGWQWSRYYEDGNFYPELFE
jgi:hypothetical protein